MAMPMQGAPAPQGQAPADGSQDPSGGADGSQVNQMIMTLGKGLGMLADMYDKLGMVDKAQAIGQLVQEYQDIVSGKGSDESQNSSPSGGITSQEAGGNPNAVPMG